jgi:hypothetical protein
MKTTVVCLGVFAAAVGILAPTVHGFVVDPAAIRQSNLPVGGIEHLGRMTDKAQLASEGKLPQPLVYPCPNDQKLLYKLGVQPASFQEVVTRSKSDDDVLSFLKASVGESKLSAVRTEAMRFRAAHQQLVGKGESGHSARPVWAGFVHDGVRGC